MLSQYAAEQLAKKLKLEATLRTELTRFFRSISRVIKPVWVTSKQTPSLEPYKADLTALLRRHYSRTQRAFTGDVTRSLQRSLNEKQETIPSVLLETEADLILASNERAPIQAERILNTTQDEFNTIVADVAVAAAIAGNFLTPVEEADEITKDFNERIKGRVSNIVVFETQAVAEQTKLIEADNISATQFLIGGVAIGQLMVKEWQTILDDKTRDSHARADGQERRQGQAFVVQGEFLKVPSDASLGASLNNIINCRCAAEFKIGV